MIGLAGMALAVQLHAQGTIDGWKITVRTTTDSGSLEHKHWFTRTMWIAGHFVRTETQELSSVARPGALAAAISDDSANTTMLVVDKTRTAMASALPATVRLQLPNDSTSRFIVAPAMTTRDLGAGEAILGHPTHKYRVTTSYVSQTTVLGSPCKRTVNSVETIWAATDLQREEQLRKYVRDIRPATGIELGPVGDSLRQFALHRERLINGLILRSEVASARPSARGAPIKVTVTTDVLELSHGPIQRSMFVVPADYKIIPPPKRPPLDSAQLKARRAAVDSSVSGRMRALMCDPAPAK